MAVEVGDEAPDFELKDQHNVPVRLSEFRERRNVVLVFYPYAFTSVCTGELRAIQDELPTFENDDVQVLSLSVDSVPAHRVFADAEGLTYPMLSDFWPHGAVARAYGVLDEERGAAVRGTFILDRRGIVRWKVVNAIPHARDLAEYEKALVSL